MATIAMIRVYLRMALVLFSMSLMMVLFLDSGTEEYALMLYSVGITGVFAIALIIALRKKRHDQNNT